MKRHIICILLVILLGVVTSVAVAWGCAWRGQRTLVNAVASGGLNSNDDIVFEVELEKGGCWKGFGGSSLGTPSASTTF